jgi:hypothetical protein
MKGQITVVLLAVLALGKGSAWAQAPAQSPYSLYSPYSPGSPPTPTPTEEALPGGDAAAAQLCCPEQPVCGPPGRFWVGAEYLLWWMRGAAVPPLVTTSPAGTPVGQAGVLGTPGAAVLFGDNHVNNDARSGFRITMGGWLNQQQTLGLEGSFFMLERLATGFSASSPGSPLLSRPFVDATTGLPAAELVAFPGVLRGTVGAAESSTGLLGAGALLRCNLCCGCGYRVDALGGYRYLRFTDGLTVTENLVSTSPASPTFIPLGTMINVTDRFATRNEFNGGDLGLSGLFWRGPWSLGLLAKLAVGNTHQVIGVDGSTTVTVPGQAPVVSPGGLLALSSNSGSFSRDRVSLVPEFGVNVGYFITPRLRVFTGYTLLYWSDVVRAGDQVDLTVNPNLLPPVTGPVSGPARPALRFQTTDLWVQGLTTGLEFRF